MKSFICSIAFVTLLLSESTVAHPSHGYDTNRLQFRRATDDLLNKGIEALGGKKALSTLKTYSTSAYLFRSNSLIESVVPGFADNAIATTGTETIAYDLSGSDVVQRIDRAYQIGEFWYFARPQLDSNNATVVVHGGAKGFACYNQGNEVVYAPGPVPWGYTDASWTRVLVRDAMRLSPNLLLAMANHSDATSSGTALLNNVSFPAVRDSILGLTVLFDPTTNLPYVIRAYENHAIFGNSTNDLLVYNYTTVNGMKFPERIKIYYNQASLLVDALFDKPTLNPTLRTGFFDGLPASAMNQTAGKTPPTPAAPSTIYSDAEVFELTQNMLWTGEYTGTLANLIVTKPMPSLPNLYHLLFSDAPAYTCVVADFGNAVMVTDAPPHQSKLVIQWIKDTLKKSPTHLLLTHHHHDHSYGAADYVAAGAKLVVPEAFTYYWSKIPGIKFATASENEPFMYKTKEMQVRGVWHSQDVHADDWMYYTWTVGCPGPNDLMAVTVADAWSPGIVGYEFDQLLPVEYLDLARADRVQRDSLVIPIHGVPSNSTDLYALTGVAYPDYKTTDFLPGGAWC